MLGQVVQGEHTRWVYEEGVAHASDYGEGLRGGHADANGRMGLLVWLGAHRQVVALVMLALEGELIGGPGLEDDFKVLLEPAPALGVGGQEGVVVLREGAAPDAEVEPSLADVVEGGDFLGDADGVAQREQQDAKADTDAFGASGDGRGHHDRRRYGLDAQTLGLFRHLEAMLKCLLVGDVVEGRELEEQSCVHDASCGMGRAGRERDAKDYPLGRCHVQIGISPGMVPDGVPVYVPGFNQFRYLVSVPSAANGCQGVFASESCD